MDSESPIFSIITPVFNGAPFIEETVKSVVDLVSPKIEYLVINDGSTDETEEILKKYSQIVTLISTQNMGEASAVNAGLRLAKGKYCLIVSADDPMLSGEILERAQSILDAKKDVVVVYPDWQIIDFQGKLIEIVKTIEYDVNILVTEFNCIPGPGAVFRLSSALEIGGRNPNFRYVSDYDFWLRMSSKGIFERCPKILAQWRKHSQSTSISSRGLEMGMERIKVMQEFLERSNLNDQLAKKAISHAYYHAALLSYFSNSVPGRYWMIKALKNRGSWIEKSDIRVVLFCLLLPHSRYMLKIIANIPFINTPIRKTN
jgi:glycosyltransferase involved in cell wall biosynthesis